MYAVFLRTKGTIVRMFLGSVFIVVTTIVVLIASDIVTIDLSTFKYLPQRIFTGASDVPECKSYLYLS